MIWLPINAHFTHIATVEDRQCRGRSYARRPRLCDASLRRDRIRTGRGGMREAQRTKDTVTSVPASRDRRRGPADILRMQFRGHADLVRAQQRASGQIPESGRTVARSGLAQSRTKAIG